MASKGGGGIDYSKWDKLDYGDSSSSDEGSNDDVYECESYRDDPPVAPRAVAPRVTRLDNPGRVTREADGTITVLTDGEAAPQPALARLLPDDGAEAMVVPPPAASPKKLKVQNDALIANNDELTKNGGSFIDPRTSSQICWRQDRHEVVLSVGFDGDRVRSRDIMVEATGAVPYGERCSAVCGGGEDGTGGCGTLRIAAKRSSTADDGIVAEVMTLLEGELPHRIYLAEDEDDVEWEVVPLSADGKYWPDEHGATGRRFETSKFVRVTLRKAAPMAGVTVWWDRPLRHCPAIDTSSIEGRKEQKAVGNAWDEAHRLFRGKVRSGEVTRAFPSSGD